MLRPIKAYIMPWNTAENTLGLVYRMYSFTAVSVTSSAVCVARRGVGMRNGGAPKIHSVAARHILRFCPARLLLLSIVAETCRVLTLNQKRGGA